MGSGGYQSFERVGTSSESLFLTSVVMYPEEEEEELIRQGDAGYGLKWGEKEDAVVETKKV